MASSESHNEGDFRGPGNGRPGRNQWLADNLNHKNPQNQRSNPHTLPIPQVSTSYFLNNTTPILLMKLIEEVITS